MKEKDKEQYLLGLMYSGFQKEVLICQTKVKKIKKYQKDLRIIDSKIREEKIRTKMLSQELENPTNLKRWRIINNQEEDIYELLDEIQKWQQRLIQKTEQVLKLDLKVKDIKINLSRNQEIFKNNPSIDIARQINQVKIGYSDLINS